MGGGPDDEVMAYSYRYYETMLRIVLDLMFLFVFLREESALNSHCLLPSLVLSYWNLNLFNTLGSFFFLDLVWLARPGVRAGVASRCAISFSSYLTTHTWIGFSLFSALSDSCSSLSLAFRFALRFRT